MNVVEKKEGSENNSVPTPEVIRSEYLIPCNTFKPARCADGRDQDPKTTTEGLEVMDGPQFLGGTYFFVYVLLRAARESGVKLSKEEAWKLTETGIGAAGIVGGVHVDDHGNETTTGCGFENKVHEKPQDYGLESEDTFAPVEATLKAKQSGIKVWILTHEHNERYAVVNKVKGTTFNTAKANHDGRSGFGHDKWATRAVFDHLHSVLNSSDNAAYRTVAETLGRKDNNGVDRAEQIEDEFLGVTLGKLAPHVVLEPGRVITVE